MKKTTTYITCSDYAFTGLGHVTFDQARRLKALGFHEPVAQFYSTDDAPYLCAWFSPVLDAGGKCDCNSGPADSYSAPELAQVRAWLYRKGYKIDLPLNRDGSMVGVICYNYTKAKRVPLSDDLFERYHDALSAAITACLTDICPDLNPITDKK